VIDGILMFVAEQQTNLSTTEPLSHS